MTIERIALTAMTALLAWVTFTVQSLAVDVAVLNNNLSLNIAQLNARLVRMETNEGK